MTTSLSGLEPSTIAPVPLERLRENSLGMIYVREWPSEINDIIRIDGWLDTKNYLFRFLDSDSAYSCGTRFPPLRYPKLPAVSFRMTTDPDPKTGAPRLRKGKTVTRRRNPIRGASSPGDLFIGWHCSHRVGKGVARPLGVFRVVSVETVERWKCPKCGGGSFLDYYHVPAAGNTTHRKQCQGCDWYGDAPLAETLTPTELGREGFAVPHEADSRLCADDFWAMLVKAGNVRDGSCCRLKFEPV